MGFIKSNGDIECELSETEGNEIEIISNFGSSDCKCSSHLLYAEKSQLLKKNLIKKHEELSEKVEQDLKG